MPENLDIKDGPTWALAREEIVTYPIGHGRDLILVATFARTVRSGRIFRRSTEQFMHLSIPLKVGDWTTGSTMTNFAESLSAELFKDPATNALCNRWSDEFTRDNGYVAHPLLARTKEPPVISQDILVDENGEVSNHLMRKSKGNLAVISWYNYKINDVAEMIQGDTSCLLLNDEESAEYADRVDPSWRAREKALRADRDDNMRLFFERFGIE
ncbi:hypothetical protein [Brachybacterium sp. YJGR34]|uniref:hypothetical protein n=1 Tax=Brachybacterium TaxID=43668 RepID=UPI000E0B4C4E|nr:hypothetical protein [Brachybacterium sp. YJGR34]